jgi:hypothetical protein
MLRGQSGTDADGSPHDEARDGSTTARRTPLILANRTKALF